MRKQQNYSKSFVVGTKTLALSTYTKDSYGSPTVNGELKLKAQPYSSTYGRNLSYSVSGHQAYAYYVPGINIAENNANIAKAQKAYTEAYNKAYARFRGKLYEGSAALGVTLGSYNQSRNMIVNRFTQLGESAENLYLRLLKNPRALRKMQSRIRRGKGLGSQSESVSGTYLEYIFGWKPLLQDIDHACKSVIQLAESRYGVNGKGSSSYRAGSSTSTSIITHSGSVQVTVAALVIVENPNLWLLERAGLVNLAAVGWDLVPWSFVVNMVTNLGQIVNSITDFVGLSFDNQSVTRSWKGHCYQWGCNTYPKSHPFYGATEAESVQWSKGRTVGSIPKPSFQFKIPEASWELAAMAASLAVQRVKRLDKLLSISF